MEKALKILSEEHKNILKMVDALVMKCNAIESGKELDTGFFKKAVGFIKNYADKFHHAKEENILFAELCKDDVQMHCNPTQQMMYEHDVGRKFVKELEKGVEEKNKDKIIQNAKGYAQLLQEHVFKEDNILYPMANDALSQGAKDIMLDKFRRIEHEMANEIDKHLSFIKELAKQDG